MQSAGKQGAVQYDILDYCQYFTCSIVTVVVLKKGVLMLLENWTEGAGTDFAGIL